MKINNGSKYNEMTQLPGGGEFKVGKFWDNCKRERRCSGPAYAQLLGNAVLGADYRGPTAGVRHERAEAARAERDIRKQLSLSEKVGVLRTDLSALPWN